MSNATSALEEKLTKEIGEHVAADLSMIIDREFEIQSLGVSRSTKRVAGESVIHLSFRIDFELQKETLGGCLLMPLPDAIAIAGYLMVMGDEEVAAEREQTNLDRSMKDAMLEVGNFVGGASDAVVRHWNGGSKMSARSGGCQGVAAGALPNFMHSAGSELIVARIRASLASFDPFEMILMLPAELLDSE